ncbi:MAG: translation initiation factor [Steroidobacteraceae bacterium]
MPMSIDRRAASPPQVRVGRKVAGRGGKGVSVISGLPLAAPDLEAMASRLKRLCGAGGRVVYRRAPAHDAWAGSASMDGHLRAFRDGVIEIQGEHRDRLVAVLRKLGYDAKRSGG